MDNARRTPARDSETPSSGKVVANNQRSVPADAGRASWNRLRRSAGALRQQARALGDDGALRAIAEQLIVEDPQDGLEPANGARAREPLVEVRRKRRRAAEEPEVQRDEHRVRSKLDLVHGGGPRAHRGLAPKSHLTIGELRPQETASAPTSKSFARRLIFSSSAASAMARRHASTNASRSTR